MAFCSEKSELIFKNHFLTILFPIDRFSEIGPSSRTFFSHDGFTCLQVLDHIHAFYQVQENLQALFAFSYNVIYIVYVPLICPEPSLINDTIDVVIFVMIGEHVKP